MVTRQKDKTVWVVWSCVPQQHGFVSFLSFTHSKTHQQESLVNSFNSPPSPPPHPFHTHTPSLSCRCGTHPVWPNS